MTYLAIAVVLLLIIAPILRILPSKRQKEQMALRRRAMGEGFSVEITRIEDPDPDPEKYVSGTGKPLERIMSVVAYRYVRKKPPDWRRLPSVDWALVRHRVANDKNLPAGWNWSVRLPVDATPNAVNELTHYFLNKLSSLPGDVVRVDETNYIISAYWTEQGGDAALDAIVAFIKGCAELSLVDESESGP